MEILYVGFCVFIDFSSKLWGFASNRFVVRVSLLHFPCSGSNLIRGSQLNSFAKKHSILPEFLLQSLMNQSQCREELDSTRNELYKTKEIYVELSKEKDRALQDLSKKHNAFVENLKSEVWEFSNSILLFASLIPLFFITSLPSFTLITPGGA